MTEVRKLVTTAN